MDLWEESCWNFITAISHHPRWCNNPVTIGSTEHLRKDDDSNVKQNPLHSVARKILGKLGLSPSTKVSVIKSVNKASHNKLIILTKLSIQPSSKKINRFQISLNIAINLLNLFDIEKTSS
jgi:hypothetical protein